MRQEDYQDTALTYTEYNLPISTAPWPCCPQWGFGRGRLFVWGFFIVFCTEMSLHQILWHSIMVAMTS